MPTYDYAVRASSHWFLTNAIWRRYLCDLLCFSVAIGSN